MPDVGHFAQQRVADLQNAQNVLYLSWKRRSLPRLHELSLGCIITPVGTALLVQLLILQLHPHARRRTWEIIEAILATFLMLCLLVAVLGMPIGTRNDVFPVQQINSL